MTNPPTLLKVLVTRRHWQVFEAFSLQYSRAANELAEVEQDPRLRNLSIAKRTFERWTGGEVQTKPHPDQCRVLEHMFKRPVADLLAPAIAPAGAEIANPAPDTSRMPMNAEPISRPTTTHRHQEALFNSGNEFIDIGTQVKMAAQRARRFAAMAEGSTIGPEMLAQLQDDVQRLATAYPRLPLSVLFADLVEVQDLAFRFLESGHQRPNQAREVYFLASIASGMLAKASHDLGDPQAAMAQARTAYVCADNADHNGMRAWVRGLQSLITYWAGQPQDAVRFAQVGNDLGSQSGSTANVWLHALEARASAALGDDAAAFRAITAAEDAREQVSDNDLDSFGGILTFPHVRQLYYVADTSVLMTATTVNAEDQAQAAVTGYQHAEPDEWAFGDQAGSHADLALARILNGTLDGVREALEPVLTLSVDQRINGVVSSAQQVHRALCKSQWNASPIARDVRDEIEAFTQLPLKALPH